MTVKIKRSVLNKLINESISKNVKRYLSEQNPPAPAGATGLKSRLAAKSGGSKDQISIDKLMMALDGLENGGKKAITIDDLNNLAKKSIEIAAPLGKGNAANLAQKATSKTGGAPVAPPPANLGQPVRQEGINEDSTGTEDEELLAAAIVDLMRAREKINSAVLVAENEDLIEEEHIEEALQSLNLLIKEIGVLIANSEKFTE
jgi:hypothetical protein